MSQDPNTIMPPGLLAALEEARRLGHVFYVTPTPPPDAGGDGDGDHKGDGDGDDKGDGKGDGRGPGSDPRQYGRGVTLQAPVGDFDVWRFPGLVAMLDYGRRRTSSLPLRDQASRCAEEKDGMRDGWYGPGAQTWDATVELVRRGWLDGARQCEAVAALAAPAGAAEEHRPLDVLGDAVELGSYLAGEPECMHAPAPARVVPVVTVAVMVSGSFVVSPQAFVTAGGAVLAAIRAVEASGTARVRVLATWCCADSEESSSPIKHTLVVAMAKEPEDSADGADFAFLVAHPAALRRLVFAVQEGMANGRARGYFDGGGMGRAMSLPVGTNRGVARGPSGEERTEKLRTMLGLRGDDGTDRGDLLVIANGGESIGTSAEDGIPEDAKGGPWGTDLAALMATVLVSEVEAACAAWQETGATTYVAGTPKRWAEQWRKEQRARR